MAELYGQNIQPLVLKLINNTGIGGEKILYSYYSTKLRIELLI